jgi:predicted dehydrogenase
MHLYAAYLGGPLDGGRMGEDHEVVLVAAADRDQAKARAVAKWRGVSPGHLDALVRIDRVDGHQVSLAEVGGGDVLDGETFN